MTGTRVHVTEHHLVVEPLGWDKVWSFRRRLRIPLVHVRGATFDPGVRDEPKGWRGPGLGLPGKLAGTFHSDGRRQFWNVTGYERAIVIALDDAQRLDRVIVTVDDPDDVVATVNDAIAPQRD